jgi:hypothetical protein
VVANVSRIGTGGRRKNNNNVDDDDDDDARAGIFVATISRVVSG